MYVWNFLFSSHMNTFFFERGREQTKWSIVKYEYVLIFILRFKENMQYLHILIQSLFQIWNFVIFKTAFPESSLICAL